VGSAAAGTFSEQQAEPLQAFRPGQVSGTSGPLAGSELPEAPAQARIGFQIMLSLTQGCDLAVCCGGDGETGTRGLQRVHKFIERRMIQRPDRNVFVHGDCPEISGCHSTHYEWLERPSLP
jgi:hypothetical protein